MLHVITLPIRMKQVLSLENGLKAYVEELYSYTITKPPCKPFYHQPS